MAKTSLKVWAGQAPFELPEDHRPAMRVPRGGSSCSSCRFVSDDRKRCGSPYFAKWNGSDVLPAPADEYCSDWYEPATDQR